MSILIAGVQLLINLRASSRPVMTISKLSGVSISRQILLSKKEMVVKGVCRTSLMVCRTCSRMCSITAISLFISCFFSRVVSYMMIFI